MIRTSAVVVNSRGLHARPSSQLAKTAAEFKSRITVAKGARTADATSIAELLMLVAPKNTELTITAKGADEKRAITAVLELIAGGFGDGVDSPAVAENPPAAEAPFSRTAQKIDGVGVSAGTVAGRALVRRADNSDAPRYHIGKREIAAEQRRFDAAVRAARSELSKVRRKISALQCAAEMFPFIDLYRALLKDPSLTRNIRAIVAEKKCNAEWAVQQHVDALSAQFLNVEDSYLRGRGDDIRQVMRRLLAAMKPRAGPKRENPAGQIIVAAELDPAHVVELKQRGYAAFATEGGGGAAHTAILARSLGMPAVVGAKGLLAAVETGDEIILDMDNNAVVVHPDSRAFAAAAAKTAAKIGKKTHTARTRRIVKTRDGQQVLMQANIELPAETAAVDKSPANGVGLFRTEFLFMGRTDPPGEDEQFEIYRQVLRDIAPRPVIMRTLDLGADKNTNDMTDSNPLGLRAIRYCLANPKIFLAQLRALLRAGREYRNLSILLPMLSHPAELAQTAALLRHAREQLKAAGGGPIPLPPLGGMIEVPAAVFVMRAFAPHLDFFSVGTNDLIQYTLAADRSDERLARYYQEPHPAIVHLLATIVENAARARKPVTICGEMAGNPQMIRLLLALGLRRLSMAVPQIEKARDIIAAADCSILAARRRRTVAAATPELLHEQVKSLNAIK